MKLSTHGKRELVMMRIGGADFIFGARHPAWYAIKYSTSRAAFILASPRREMLLFGAKDLTFWLFLCSRRSDCPPYSMSGHLQVIASSG